MSLDYNIHYLYNGIRKRKKDKDEDEDEEANATSEKTR